MSSPNNRSEIRSKDWPKSGLRSFRRARVASVILILLILLMLLSLMLLTSCKLSSDKDQVEFERSGKDLVVHIEAGGQPKAIQLNQTIILGSPK